MKRVLHAETPCVSLQFVSEPEATRHICADNIKKDCKKVHWIILADFRASGGLL